MSRFRRVVCLCGGVGGARLLHGLAQVLAPEQLTAIVNTGDDFHCWGLAVSPDLDTCMYTLAGLADEARGWGLANETFRARAAMERLGAPDWFALGDSDLATQLVRTEALRAGRSLTQITAQLCRDLGVAHTLLPMSDAPRPTLIDTFEHGQLSFQEWLVKLRAPAVRGVRFAGVAHASAEVLAALADADLVIFGPSNPYVSIDPILTLDGVRACLLHKPVVALSPLVHGRAVKGPLAEMVRTLAGREPSIAALVDHYGSLLKGLVIELGDEQSGVACPVLPTRTIMGGAADRARLARELLRFAEGLP